MRVGAYELGDEVGRGGAGVVYRARGPEGEVAVKLLAKLDPEKQARFEREVRLQERLAAEGGFVPVLAKDLESGRPYLVLPFLAGGTLRDRLDRGPLSVEETVALGRALGLALGRAHERGIVHRDLKPENVLFEDASNERPLIADLGLAKHFRSGDLGASRSLQLSVRGEARGTFGYMPSEQIADAASVGPEANVFALGAILYECLAGQPAFAGESLLEVIAKVEACAPSGLREIFPETPQWLAAAIARALSKERSERYADGAELARALVEPEGRRRSRALPVALAAGAALGLVVLLSWVFVTKKLSPPTPNLNRDPERARELVKSAEAEVDAKNFDRAIEDTTEAIKLDPALARAWAFRAVARNNKGDLDGAIADSDQALKLERKCALAWYARGWARVRKHELDGGVANLSEAIRLDPQLFPPLLERGRIRLDKGDLEGAIADFTEAIKVGPRRALAWAGRGEARELAGDRDDAIADFNEAIRLDAKLAAAWAGRGVSRVRKKDWDGARADFTEALELDPKLSLIWLNRGVVRRELGDTQGAIGDYERYLELAPGDANAPRVRAELEKLRARSQQ